LWDSRAVDSRLLWAGQCVSGMQTASESVEDTVAGSGGRVVRGFMGQPQAHFA
jgi:hypothetical protein